MPLLANAGLLLNAGDAALAAESLLDADRHELQRLDDRPVPVDLL